MKNMINKGEPQMEVTHDNKGNVHVILGEDISRFAMSPVQAINFARVILRHAGVKKVEITP